MSVSGKVPTFANRQPGCLKQLGVSELCLSTRWSQKWIRSAKTKKRHSFAFCVRNKNCLNNGHGGLNNLLLIATTQCEFVGHVGAWFHYLLRSNRWGCSKLPKSLLFMISTCQPLPFNDHTRCQTSWIASTAYIGALKIEGTPTF